MQAKKGADEGCAGGGLVRLRKKLTMKRPSLKKDSVETEGASVSESRESGPDLDPFKLKKITPLKRFVGVISMPPSPFDLGFDKRLKKRRHAIHKFDKIMSISGVELQRYLLSFHYYLGTELLTRIVCYLSGQCVFSSTSRAWVVHDLPVPIKISGGMIQDQFRGCSDVNSDVFSGIIRVLHQEERAMYNRNRTPVNQWRHFMDPYFSVSSLDK